MFLVVVGALGLDPFEVGAVKVGVDVALQSILVSRAEGVGDDQPLAFVLVKIFEEQLIGEELTVGSAYFRVGAEGTPFGAPAGEDFGYGIDENAV